MTSKHSGEHSWENIVKVMTDHDTEAIDLLISDLKPKQEDFFIGEDTNIFNRESLCAAAVQGGSLKSLKYLRDNGVEWDERVCTFAAEKGRYDIIKYARENKCPWDEDDVGTFAAENGHIDLLGKLKELDFEFPSYITAMAAIGGRLKTLKYLVKEGHCVDDYTFTAALEGGDSDILEYLYKNHNGKEMFNEASYVTCIQEEHLNAIKWLLKKNTPYNKEECEKITRRKKIKDITLLFEQVLLKD